MRTVRLINEDDDVVAVVEHALCFAELVDRCDDDLANVLVEQGQDVADYYDAIANATGEFKLASNWIQQDVLRTIKEKKLTVAEFPVSGINRALLLRL